MWKPQNHELHGIKDMDMRHIRQTEEAKICELHKHPESLLAGDRNYCEQPLWIILKSKAPFARTMVKAYEIRSKEIHDRRRTKTKHDDGLLSIGDNTSCRADLR